MVKSKKALGLVLSGAMVLTGVGTTLSSVGNVTVVQAAVKDDVKAVHNKVEQLVKSIKKNYLGLKNVGQWQKYIKEARDLNARLPKGSTKNKYAERINKAEAVVNAAARVNQLEISMKKNSHTNSNLAQWLEYTYLAAVDMQKIDKKEYAAQYNELDQRMEERANELEEIAKKLSDEADGEDVVEDEETVDLTAVIESANPSNIKITFDEVVKSSEKDLKDSLVVKVDKKVVGIKSATVSEDGLSINIVLDEAVKKGQEVTFTIKEGGSLEDESGNSIYTDEEIEVDNNIE